MDIALSSLGLLLCLPLFAFAALLIKLDSRGPVFFKHRRMGRDFRPFDLCKFRTMVNGKREGLPLTVAGDPRITSAGRFLRMTKIDELPQLWNVLKGDMSLVGPRPEAPKYVEMFSDEYGAILGIRPGITDYAAIKFRDEENILRKYRDSEEGYVREVLPQKIELYKKYLREKSLLIDLKLIFLTLFAVLGRRKR